MMYPFEWLWVFFPVSERTSAFYMIQVEEKPSIHKNPKRTLLYLSLSFLVEMMLETQAQTQVLLSVLKCMGNSLSGTESIPECLRNRISQEQSLNGNYIQYIFLVTRQGQIIKITPRSFNIIYWIPSLPWSVSYLQTHVFIILALLMCLLWSNFE